MKPYLSLFILLLALPSHKLLSFEFPWLSETKLQGHFVQEKHIAALSRPFITKGQYLYTAKDGLTWHTQRPVNNQLLINQDGVSEVQTDGSLKVLTSDTSFSSLLLPIFSANTDKLKTEFSIAENKNGLTLIPLNPKILDLIQSLNLVITEQTLQQITLNESNGNLTHIFLEDLSKLEEVE